MKLKKYSTNLGKVKRPQKPEASGIACSEKKCKGEMMILVPHIEHPQLHPLKRASCSVCGWRGWV